MKKEELVKKKTKELVKIVDEIDELEGSLEEHKKKRDWVRCEIIERRLKILQEKLK